MSDPVMPRDAIERLCKLQEAVASHMGYANPTDCFCGRGGQWSDAHRWPNASPYYRNDGSAIEYIERAVRLQIHREQIGRRHEAEAARDDE